LLNKSFSGVREKATGKKATVLREEATGNRQQATVLREEATGNRQ
jgi:hypothetical protein